ncbi:Cytochrome c heme lyase subunit CcmH [Thioalkalivibrio nitratireducens DSM 14787]|uniref:Cytochrome c heme lyase subunit CcmH n=1 Tax=Thioalkalivibrio nitratireducens (strain DSM 14787 / UNIQEM 213 / ALEN2) TaxID=1255043 RepID=L0DZ81_THIND|nr:c-type cytochrome biogenesis protein CcmI [Thioalkalivibrio nitratireducens]AGA33691.1 Cytochrome c heme lyase subunit CcmH [Thioalkalivibrio nitratireducens DSM 14787]
MTLFWSMAAVLTAVSLLFLFVPMLRARSPRNEAVSTEGMAAAVDVYHAQLAELEADREAGAISEAQYTTARLDLQRSLLEMSEDRETAGSQRLQGSWRWPSGIVSLVAVPVLAVLIYQAYGSGPAGLDPQASAPQQTAGTEPGGMDGSIEAAVQALSARLEANPEDPDGWALLGRSLLFLEQPRAAAGAYAQAIRHGGNQDPEILTTYADLLGSLDGGDLSARAKPFIEQALAIEPDHVNGLWLAGLAAFRSSDYPQAQDYWERLASQFEPGSEEARIIRSNLDEVEERMRNGATAEDSPVSAGN